VVILLGTTLASNPFINAQRVFNQCARRVSMNRNTEEPPPGRIVVHAIGIYECWRSSMIVLRQAETRGRTDIDWLDSRHTFSFGDYYDPAALGFSALRVINEDRVTPGRGFPTHGHRDMEILSYVLEGALEHKDSLGTGSIIRPGEVQRMTAGTGVRHSEKNASAVETVHFLQIWILPAREGLAPGYEQKAFAESERSGRLCLVASSDGREGSVVMHQDASLYIGEFGVGEQAVHASAPGRSAYVHVARGEIELRGGDGSHRLGAGSGAAITGESRTVLAGLASDAGRGEVLLFDLP
jgi:redox-sensitive bicupin YhaK (pirin superfamily)